MPIKVQARISDDLAARLDAEVTRLQAQQPASETNRSTVVRAALTEYLNKKESAKMFKCQVCGKEFSVDTEMLSMFADPAPTVCSDECGKKARDQKVKENHENDATAPDCQGPAKGVWPQ